MQAEIRYVYKLDFHRALDLILETDKDNVTNDTCPDDDILTEIQELISNNVEPTDEYDEWFAQGYADVINKYIDVKYNASMSTYSDTSIFVDVSEKVVAKALVSLLFDNIPFINALRTLAQDAYRKDFQFLLNLDNVGYLSDVEDDLEADRIDEVGWFNQTFKDGDLSPLLIGDILLCYMAQSEDKLDTIEDFIDDLGYDVSELNTDDECASQYDNQSWEKCLNYINSHWKFVPRIECSPSMFFYHLEQYYNWQDGKFVSDTLTESLKENLKDKLIRLIGEEKC